MAKAKQEKEVDVKALKPHVLAELFPAMDPEALQALTDDIKANGQHHAIVLYEGRVLDGRSRLAACLKAKVKPKFMDLPMGTAPRAFVYGANAHRRHLTKFQVATLAAAYRASSKSKLSLDEVGEMFGVNKSMVSYADRLLASGIKELVAMASDPETTAASARTALEAKGLAENRPPKATYDASENLTLNPETGELEEQAAEDSPVDLGTSAPAPAPAATPRATQELPTHSLAASKAAVRKASEASVTHVQKMQSMAQDLARSTEQDLECFIKEVLKLKVWPRLQKCMAKFEAGKAVSKAKATSKVAAPKAAKAK